MAENGKDSMVALNLRIAPAMREALDRMVADEKTRATGADLSDCARRAMSAGLMQLGYLPAPEPEQPSTSDDPLERR